MSASREVDEDQQGVTRGSLGGCRTRQQSRGTRNGQNNINQETFPIGRDHIGRIGAMWAVKGAAQ